MAEWSPARRHSFIVSVLRAGTRRWPAKYETLAAAKTEKKKNKKTGREAQHYFCTGCGEDFPAKEVQVNHKEPVVSVEDGFISWDTFIERLYCSKNNLEVLCRACHKEITKKENELRKKYKNTPHKETYQCWRDMKGRCFNPNSARYYTHGARGITVCDEWKDSFEAFFNDMGRKPEGMSLDRIDNDGNYTKENCRWATSKEQANNRRTNILITFGEDTLTVQQWADSLGISFACLQKRLSKWSLEKALSPEYFGNQHVPEEIKKEILSLYSSKEYTQKQLANIYGVSQGAISKWVVEQRKTK